MAENLGFLAGCGMLALIGTLVVSFLRQMGWLSRDTSLLLGRSAAMTCAAGLLYFLLALLSFLAVYGKIESQVNLSVLFRGSGMSRMISALYHPETASLDSAAFAWLSFLAGSVLFGQYEFCGICLAWCLTAASLFLVQKRFRSLADDKTARDMAFLLLCLPGGVFLMLPGWAPVLLLVCAVGFDVLGKRLHSWKARFSPVAYGWIITVCAVLSAAVTIAAAEGRIG